MYYSRLNQHTFYNTTVKLSKSLYEDEEEVNYIRLFDVEKNISEYTKYAKPFQINSNGIYATLIGRITFRGYPLSIDIKANIPITTEVGFGAALEYSSAYDIKLKNEGKNYQIKYPISISLKPNEAERIALKFTAEKTSIHNLKVALDNINGIDIESKPISLSIFQPRTFKELLNTVFVCSQCGNDSPKWLEKCPVCGEWDTYIIKKANAVKE